MPKGPLGGMPMPGGFGGVMGQVNKAFQGPLFNPIKDQVNSAMSTYVNPMLSKMTSGANLPPQIQQMIQSITGGFGGAPQSQAPAPQVNNTGGGGFWNPNKGVQGPDIGNTPSTTSPTTPFAMPQAPGTIYTNNPSGGPPTPAIPTTCSQPTNNQPGWGTQVPGVNAKYWGAFPSPGGSQLGGVHMPVVK
jgi:hypothetical protein